MHNIIIYGSGQAGKKIYKNLLGSNYNVIAFIDDKLKKKKIFNLPLIKRKNLKSFIKKNNIKEIILCIPSLAENKKISILKFLSTFKIKISSISDSVILKNHVGIKDISDISEEYLLSKNLLSYHNYNKFLKNKIILITGATGSIGSKLVKNIIKAKPKKIIICDMDEFGIYNITREANLIKKKYRINCKIVVKLGNLININFVSSIFYNSPKVDYIYHCAAYKHVDIVEENFSEGFYNNVKSTLNLLETLKTIDYKSFILISTDKAVDPINIMGATKRLCEKLTLSYNDNQKNFRNKVIRFGNVFASKGSAIPLIFHQIKNDEFVTITNVHMTRYFLTSEEACTLIISASKFKKKYGDILLFDMGKAKNILQIAKYIATILNKKIRIRLIGVRPGEKIHEKLHNQKRTFKTNNKSIYAIKDHYYSHYDITRQLNYLFSLYEDNNYRELKLKIMEFARH